MKPTPIWNFGRMVCRPFCSAIFDLKVYGKEHVPKNGGVLIVSNHQSYLDPVLLGVPETLYLKCLILRRL